MWRKKTDLLKAGDRGGFFIKFKDDIGNSSIAISCLKVVYLVKDSHINFTHKRQSFRDICHHITSVSTLCLN